MEGNISTERKNGISEITFYHPAHNSMPGYLLGDLKQAIEQESETNETKVILIKAAGNRTFCAGASFDELLAISNPSEGKEFFMGFARVINACRTSRKFIISRVQGKAIGGGVGLASATDYCFGTQFSSVKLSELALGIGPFVVGPAVERKIGTAAFSQMSINAFDWQTANWAWQKGLFSEVFKNAEEMDLHIEQFCSKLVEMSIPAMTKLKRILWEDCDHWEKLLEQRAEMSGSLILTSEAKAAINAVKNKS